MGLWLFLAGMALGFGVMLFVVLFESSSSFQALTSPAMTEVVQPLGYALEGGTLLAFGLTLAGIACCTFAPTAVETEGRTAAPRLRRGADDAVGRHGRTKRRRSPPPVPHGST